MHRKAKEVFSLTKNDIPGFVDVLINEQETALQFIPNQPLEQKLRGIIGGVTEQATTLCPVMLNERATNTSTQIRGYCQKHLPKEVVANGKIVVFATEKHPLVLQFG